MLLFTAVTLGDRGICCPLSRYHAVGNSYLKYPWEHFMQKVCITYSFTVDNPNIFDNILLFVGQDQLGENYLSRSWGSQSKTYA